MYLRKPVLDEMEETIMEENSLLAQSVERKDGDSIPHLKSGPEIRRLLQDHQKEENGFETAAWLSFLDSTTPKREKIHVDDMQATDCGCIMLGAFPNPAEAENWIRFAEEKQLNCLDAFFRRMAECYANGVCTVYDEGSTNDGADEERPSNHLSAAASGDAKAMFSLYEMLSNGKNQRRKNSQLKLSLLIPLIFGVIAVTLLPTCIEYLFSWADLPSYGKIEHSILAWGGFVLHLTLYYLSAKRVLAMFHSHFDMYETKRSELLKGAAAGGHLDARYLLAMQRPHEEQDIAFSECLACAQDGHGKALETLRDWYQKGFGPEDARAEAASFLTTGDGSREVFAPSYEKQLEYAKKAADINEKHLPHYASLLCQKDQKKAAAILERRAEAGNAACMMALTDRTIYGSPAEILLLAKDSLIHIASLVFLFGVLRLLASSAHDDPFASVFFALFDFAFEWIPLPVLSLIIVIIAAILIFTVTYILYLVIADCIFSAGILLFSPHFRAMVREAKGKNKVKLLRELFVGLFLVGIRDPLSYYWEKRAADAGNVKALFNISASIRDPQERFKCIEQAAGKGYAPAELLLSQLYEDGSKQYRFWRDPDKAFLLAEKMADDGTSSGLARLALCFEQGIGVEKNPDQAARLLFLANYGKGANELLDERLVLLRIFGRFDPLYDSMAAIEKEQLSGKKLQDVFTAAMCNNGKH